MNSNVKVENYSDDYGMIHANRDEVSENPILFTTYAKIVGVVGRPWWSLATLIHHHEHKGRFIQTPWSKDDRASWDNMVAIDTILYKAGGYRKKLSFEHPRSFLYQLHLFYPYMRIFTTIPLAIMMLISCLRTYQVRPNFWEMPTLWYKRITKQIYFHTGYSTDFQGEYRIIYKYKNPPNPEDPFLYWKDRRISTSTKLLSWLMLETNTFGPFKKLCYYILRKKFGNNFIYKVFQIYFRSNNHPIVQKLKD